MTTYSFLNASGLELLVDRLGSDGNSDLAKTPLASVWLGVGPELDPDFVGGALLHLVEGLLFGLWLRGDCKVGQCEKTCSGVN